MIHNGILEKFEPTKQGLTITVKVSDDQIQNIVNLFRQGVDIVPTGQPEPESDEVKLFNDILIELRRIRADGIRLEKQILDILIPAGEAAGTIEQLGEQCK